jgi:tagatose-1,6-bisphosphate aldolase non-catalytic subunit AgaZ/GatZ
MLPSDFRIFAENIAADAHLDPQRLVLGGDHLGPNPWRHLPAAEAMQHAKRMVSIKIPESILSLFLPTQYTRVCTGEIAGNGTSLIVDKVKDVLRIYAQACKPSR